MRAPLPKPHVPFLWNTYFAFGNVGTQRSVAQRGIPACVVDMELRAEHVVNFLVADAQSKQFIPPALLAGEIKWWRVPFAFSCTGIHQDGVARVRTTKVRYVMNIIPDTEIEHLRSIFIGLRVQSQRRW